jgi:plastocyanin
VTPRDSQFVVDWWKRLAVISGLSIGLFAICASRQTVRPAFASAAAITVESGARVSIANFAFAPEEITIAPGEIVTWANDDGAPHGLKYHDGAKGADLLLPGTSFSRRFDSPGTYDYNCSVHPYMTGRVVVRAQ